ncbi:hypothetical protein TGRUB_232500 [Toxoplasma gondii RUB]|uniref:Inner centromere protein ARK-binding domain-containing protein n=6 Tax=Toxoplasma gondii TaxID=5811 RepID=S7V2Y7_TOXGG|nr:hypothetical protein TGGT1_232500 [Toxoplasma gondii GT1]KAF4641846.1 hypothetical protein TGRH88_076580 [Toxoplasma gondii]KFG48724.1 hypothetical protein TGDOM2_232500 [Toxoplasma gondii GAB2-2007-GAL-DOM2]KFG55288.1 hypothetical protein TGFOU_232500 [Toxoplasma gondii FOU]KFG63797.1 hypothetical protein TGRUB_232500 [Toxoplasma gondii RUB]PUA92628.1 hypothetical protein TGBR9_232500 [Toxoplasma gondii TgCATBr9]
MPSSRGKTPPTCGGHDSSERKKAGVTAEASEPSSVSEMSVTAFTALKTHLQCADEQKLNDLFAFVSRRSSLASALSCATPRGTAADTFRESVTTPCGMDFATASSWVSQSARKAARSGAVNGAREPVSPLPSAHKTGLHPSTSVVFASQKVACASKTLLSSHLDSGARVPFLSEAQDNFSTTTTSCPEPSRPARVSTSSSWSSTSPFAAASFFVTQEGLGSTSFCHFDGPLSPDCSPNGSLSSDVPAVFEPKASPASAKKSFKLCRQLASPGSARTSEESQRACETGGAAESSVPRGRQKKASWRDQNGDDKRASPVKLRASPRFSPGAVKLSAGKTTNGSTPLSVRTPTRSSPRLQLRAPSPTRAGDSRLRSEGGDSSRQRSIRKGKGQQITSKLASPRKASQGNILHESVAEPVETASAGGGAGERSHALNCSNQKKSAAKKKDESAGVSAGCRRRSNTGSRGTSPRKETPRPASKQRQKGARKTKIAKSTLTSEQTAVDGPTEETPEFEAYSISLSPSLSLVKRGRDTDDYGAVPNSKRKKHQLKKETVERPLESVKTVDGTTDSVCTSRGTSKTNNEHALVDEESAPEPDPRNAAVVNGPTIQTPLSDLVFVKPVTSLSDHISADDGDARHFLLPNGMMPSSEADWRTEEQNEDEEMREAPRPKIKGLYESSDKARRMLSTASTVSGGGASNPPLRLLVADAPHSPEIDTGAFCSPALSSSEAPAEPPAFFHHKVLRPTPPVAEAPEFDLGLFMVRTAALSKHADDVVPCLADKELMEFSIVPQKYITPSVTEKPTQTLQERFLHMKLLADIPKVDGTYQIGLDMKEATWYRPKNPETGMAKPNGKGTAMKKLLEEQERWNPFSVFGSSLPCVELDDVFDYEVYSTTAPSARVSHPLFRRLAQFYEFKDLWKTVTPAEWDKVRSSFKTHWKKQYKLDLDWRNDPVTVEEFMWMLEANGQTDDKTETVFHAEVCFCVTPNPTENFAWNDPRCHKYQAPRPSMSHHLHERLNDDENTSPNSPGPKASIQHEVCQVKRRSVDDALPRRLSIGSFESGSARRRSLTDAFSPECSKFRRDVLS